MSTNQTSLGRDICGCCSTAEATRYDNLKTSIHFEHIREQSGQACSRLVCMIMYPDLSKSIAAFFRSGIIRICFLFTMSWNPQLARAGFWLCITSIAKLVLVWTSSCTREKWWSRTGSNRRPEACKATALPTELRPHFCLASNAGGCIRSLGLREEVRGAHSRLRLFEPVANLARLELNAEGIARPTGRRARLRESRAAHEPHNGGPGRT